MMISVFGKVENKVEKGENANNRWILLYPRCFQNLLYLEKLKVGNVWQLMG